MNSSETLAWLQSTIGRQILKEIKDKKKEIALNMANGGLLGAGSDHQLNKDYSYNVGIFEGLSIVENLIEETVESDIDAN